MEICLLLLKLAQLGVYRNRTSAALLSGVFVVLGAGMVRAIDPATPIASAQTTPATGPATGDPIEAVASTATAEILIVPTCPPPGEPLYPAGTTMTDTEITLPEGLGATEAWFDVFIKNWALTGMRQSANNIAACDHTPTGVCCDGQHGTDCFSPILLADCGSAVFIDAAYCPKPPFDLLANPCTEPLPADSACHTSGGANGGAFAGIIRMPVGPTCGPERCSPNPMINPLGNPWSPNITFIQTGADLQFTSVAAFPGVVDNGTPKYVFTLKISRADGGSFAPGSLTVECANVGTETALWDQYGRPIFPLTQTPANLTVLTHALSVDSGGVAASPPCVAAPPTIIPAVSSWGLLITALVLLAAAKLRWRRTSA